MEVIMQPGKLLHLRQNGFTYLVMLFALLIFSIGLAALGEVWSTTSKRDKEAELIQNGNEIELAISSYYNHSPGTVKKYPNTFQDLLQDKRYVGTVRYLRTIPRDPITNSTSWGLIPAQDGGFMGAYSLSNNEIAHKKPIFLPDGSMIVGVRYLDWKFIYTSKQ
jgi:type II secretory pathway pseudopilin PulG